MEFPVTITLKKPVRHGSKDVAELAFEREVQAGDLFDINLVAGLTGRDFANVIARLTGQPVPVIARLSAGDFARCGELVNGFLTDGPGTGPTD